VPLISGGPVTFMPVLVLRLFLISACYARHQASANIKKYNHVSIDFPESRAEPRSFVEERVPILLCTLGHVYVQKCL